MSFSGLISKMLVLFIFICIGYFCGKVKIIDDNGSKTLNKLVLNIAAPGMILNSVLNTQLSYAAGDLLKIFLYGVIFNVMTLAIGFACVRIFCRDKERRGLLNLVISFGNIAFMGYPVISALYGGDAVFIGSIITIPFNMLLFSAGVVLIVGKGSGGVPYRRIFLNPSFGATVLAILIFSFRVTLPGPVSNVLEYLANMVIPMTMLIIGASLGRMTPRNILFNGSYYLVSLCKLLIMPVVMWLLFRTFVHDELLLGILVVMGAMPTAALTPILCTEYGSDNSFASGSVFITTLLSLLTAPAIVYLFLL